MKSHAVLPYSSRPSLIYKRAIRLHLDEDKYEVRGVVAVAVMRLSESAHCTVTSSTIPHNTPKGRLSCLASSSSLSRDATSKKQSRRSVSSQGNSFPELPFIPMRVDDDVVGVFFVLVSVLVCLLLVPKHLTPSFYCSFCSLLAI